MTDTNMDIAGHKQDTNGKVVLGIIGVAGRGFDSHLKTFSQFEDVEIGAVCDVYQPYVERAVAYTEGKAKGYHDYRDLLADPNIDAVVVATPPHWHALMTLDALQAGKDVYCEKPMCRFPVEGRLMTDWAARYGRITQVGTQIHATANYHKCVDVVRSGVSGADHLRPQLLRHERQLGRAWHAARRGSAGRDWIGSSWLGPAPETPFNQRPLPGRNAPLFQGLRG